MCEASAKGCVRHLQKVFNLVDVIKPVEHKEQKRKLLLTEDGTVYKVKRSKLDNNVKAGQYV